MATRHAVPGSATTALVPPSHMTARERARRSDWVRSLDLIPLLTDRELEVFRLLAEGPTNIEIAETLFITERTVRAHTASILLKLRLDSRLKASMAAFAYTQDIMTCGCEGLVPARAEPGADLAAGEQYRHHRSRRDIDS